MAKTLNGFGGQMSIFGLKVNVQAKGFNNDYVSE